MIHLKRVSLIALLVSVALVFSGCLKTKITTGQQSSNQTEEMAWAHGFVNGLVPPVNAPLQVGETCTNGVSDVYFRQTFPQVLVQGLTSSLYTPQRFTVTCASGSAMSSASPEKTPPAYLLRENQEAVSAWTTADATDSEETK